MNTEIYKGYLVKIKVNGKIINKLLTDVDIDQWKKTFPLLSKVSKAQMEIIDINEVNVKVI